MVKLEVLILGGCVNSPHGPYGPSSTSEQSLREIADSQRQESAPAGAVMATHPHAINPLFGLAGGRHHFGCRPLTPPADFEGRKGVHFSFFGEEALAFRPGQRAAS